jgi:hypothetical protein
MKNIAIAFILLSVFTFFFFFLQHAIEDPVLSHMKLYELLFDKDIHTRVEAADKLFYSNDETAQQVLLDALINPDYDDKINVACILMMQPADRNAVEGLIKALHPDNDICYTTTHYINDALQRITGEQFDADYETWLTWFRFMQKTGMKYYPPDDSIPARSFATGFTAQTFAENHPTYEHVSELIPILNRTESNEKERLSKHHFTLVFGNHNDFPNNAYWTFHSIDRTLRAFGLGGWAGSLSGPDDEYLLLDGSYGSEMIDGEIFLLIMNKSEDVVDVILSVSEVDEAYENKNSKMLLDINSLVSSFPSPNAFSLIDSISTKRKENSKESRIVYDFSLLTRSIPGDALRSWIRYKLRALMNKAKWNIKKVTVEGHETECLYSYFTSDGIVIVQMSKQKKNSFLFSITISKKK